MEKILLILVILTSTIAFAKSPKPKSIDLSGYILIKSETETTPFSDHVNLRCLQMLSDKMLADKTPETECSDVVLKNTILKSYRNRDPNDRFDRDLYIVRLLTETYCKPRSYSDVALMSLFKKCKESPQQDCFNPQLISKLNQVKRTTITEFNTDDCNF